ncbi:hypothetical protein A3F34_00910 [Candidatus Roizmanbacteria bacterium RIFCSPHIGHO2_12_FULL_44_10]|uniref:Probable transcriptional regulatory protein A3F34_00910 n=1 Tax=Candidatus Roizmanbacteria bacterium RIFCSPHIGHO2_12_FULL_44_10 TaxID=1802054 RepID=A0A1F7I9I2_9BACT|nr:MAG: hypothetical protein A3F34_00910 [Candidatus Roizmanbacteria bacterium RIFCSPHIGHO2_12_FULL_44_10]
MSGHSKWSTIKRKKGINDQQRSKIFTKMTRLITSAVHEGGNIADVENNFRLRLAIERAKSVNMPKDTIDRAIEKAAGGEGQPMKEILYEGFGPGGVALLIAATTDNTNRTYSEIKQLLDRNGGKLAGQHAVAYLFNKCGVVIFRKSDNTEEAVFAFGEGIGALDIEEDEEQYVVYIPFESIGKVKHLETDAKPQQIDIDYRPTTKVNVGEEAARITELTEKLAELDEVQTVYTNAD